VIHAQLALTFFDGCLHRPAQSAHPLKRGVRAIGRRVTQVVLDLLRPAPTRGGR
jgi:hypothetical protein